MVTLISNNYVEEIDLDHVMNGAMHGLADGLDPDTAYLDAGQTASYEKQEALPTGRTGIELTRQHYLRVIAAREGSPAAKAGLQPGDYIRAIDGQSTRDTSVFAGTRLLAGKPGTTVRLTVLRGTPPIPTTWISPARRWPNQPCRAASRRQAPGWCAYLRSPPRRRPRSRTRWPGSARRAPRD
ncbi:MAG: PDZ domain-containing protein [Vicinamibacterales bacterium]